MNTLWIPLSLRLARASLRPALLTLPLLAGGSVVWAQDAPRIIFPKDGDDVRGEITVRFDGIPAGGYVKVLVNGQLKSATAQNSYPLDTIADTATFNGDGEYKLDITSLNASGRIVGTSSVKFMVANNKVAGQSESVRLVHWTPQDRLIDGVQRYRVRAESNADIQESTGGGGSGGSSGGGRGASSGGGEGGGSSGDIPAPLDWQVDVLLRRVVRDVNGYTGAANIATLVQDALQRQREGADSGGGGADGGSSSGGRGGSSRGGSSGASTSTPGVKAPWTTEWTRGPEYAKFYVKAVQKTGDEINATRKANNVAIADLLPTFPTVPVRPGSTWNSRQSILSDLSTRKPINIEGAITFTAYENIQTPAGENRRCAKIESRFPLPENVAKRIAADLGSKVGSAGGASGGGEGGSRGASSGGSRGGGDSSGATEPTLTPDDIKVASFNMARVIWFDMDKHQVVRAEDNLKAYFEIPPADNGAGGEGGGRGLSASSGGGRGRIGSSSDGTGEGGADQAPAEPTKVNYTMNITTVLDDRIPSPTVKFTGGAGTAHSRDNVNEPGIARATRR